jgi:phenylacetate-coenzyme A ligase PaaK-like adenylate-forming protein
MYETKRPQSGKTLDDNNIYPSHIDQIFSQIEGAGSEYQIIFDRMTDGKDYTLRLFDKRDD